MLLLACGDGLNAGPPDAANQSPPTISGDIPAVDPPQLCWGAEQIGCDPGEKCGIIGDEWSCQAEGSQALRETCSSTALGDDCAAGLHCYEGSCYQLCTALAPCDQSDTRCVPVPAQAPDLAICLDNCSPLAQDCQASSTGARQGCYIYLSGPVCAPVSSSPPTVPGLACDFLNECTVGAGCVKHQGRNQCMAYCDYQNNANGPDPLCAIEDRCRSLEGSSSVGVCSE